MTRKQETPAPAMFAEQRTTLRVPAEHVERILRIALEIPVEARFSCVSDYGATFDVEFTWSSTKPLGTNAEFSALWRDRKPVP